MVPAQGKWYLGMGKGLGNKDVASTLVNQVGRRRKVKKGKKDSETMEGKDGVTVTECLDWLFSAVGEDEGRARCHVGGLLTRE